MRVGLVCLSLAVVLASCSAADRSGFGDAPPPPDTELAPPSIGDRIPTVHVTLKGTVFAPNETLPLSNALVYFTQEPPAEIPRGAYCDECVKLDDGTFVVSKADGTFELTTDLRTGKTFVVVQKGQFRRVRAIEITKDETIEIDPEMTTLPAKTNAARGDNTPRMAILKDDADFDHIDESLQKLGISEMVKKTDRTLLENEAELMKFQIVFVPCGMSDDPTPANATAKANMQKFVEAGGKLYVTDWSYEFVRQPFAGFLKWEGETPELGSATGEMWDAPAQAVDPGLRDWLNAVGDTSFEVVGNWTTIASVNPTMGKNAKGDPVLVTPKVWVTATKEGKSTPTTVSFENKCGRVLFSTYHTESGFGGSSDLLAQEKALLYVLLEVGVCVGKRPGVQ
jgi:hypothetical protein